jgi:hypothetical protein
VEAFLFPCDKGKMPGEVNHTRKLELNCMPG